MRLWYSGVVNHMEVTKESVYRLVFTTRALLGCSQATGLVVWEIYIDNSPLRSVLTPIELSQD